jgi:hypothetical protein
VGEAQGLGPPVLQADELDGLVTDINAGDGAATGQQGASFQTFPLE